MKILKPLAIAAALAAVVTPALAGGKTLKVDFELLQPVACRNLDDAIEASRFNNFERDQLAKVNFLRSKRGTCGIGHSHVGIGHEGNLFLTELRQLKWSVPNLPPGMIAICVTGPTVVWADCTGTASQELKLATGYWVVTKPENFLRNFDLPRD